MNLQLLNLVIHTNVCDVPVGSQLFVLSHRHAEYITPLKKVKVGRTKRPSLVDNVRYSIYWIRCCFMETTWEPCVCQSSSHAGQWQIAFAVSEYPLFFFCCPLFPLPFLLLVHFLRLWHFMPSPAVTFCQA